ncbi:MAG: DUF3472 domain-containing protein [Gammaproteobacteria bacterium]
MKSIDSIRRLIRAFCNFFPTAYPRWQALSARHHSTGLKRPDPSLLLEQEPKILRVHERARPKWPVALGLAVWFGFGFGTSNAAVVILHQWGDNDGHGASGDLFVYNNPSNHRNEYFKLKQVGSDGRYPSFPTDGRDNDTWMHLPQRPDGAATSIVEIDHASQLPTPEKTLATGSCTDCSGAQGIYYSFENEPVSGFDAIKFRMRPMTDHPDNNTLAYYWAYSDYFVGSQNLLYFGLQPRGQHGKTALFSVFYAGTSADPSTPQCKPGADNYPGTNCHIGYPWSVGKDYDFTVTLAKVERGKETWEGRVYDVATKQSTLIGKIIVASTTGIGKEGNHFAFDEYFRYQEYPCQSQPASEILFFTPTGYYQSQAHPGSISSLALKGGCNVRFFSDNRTYSYIDAGH